MKSKIISFIIIIIVAIFSFFQTGCTTNKPIEIEKVTIKKILPTPVRPMVLLDTTYVEKSGYVCLSPTDYIKESKNVNEVDRYIEQLINENKILRKLIAGDEK